MFCAFVNLVSGRLAFNVDNAFYFNLLLYFTITFRFNEKYLFRPSNFSIALSMRKPQAVMPNV